MNIQKSVRGIGLIFSKDRAMQLDATLRSLQFHCSDLCSIQLTVLYKASTLAHQEQYHTLIAEHPLVEFIREIDFKSQVCAILKNYDFVLFLVDDNLFVRAFSLEQIVAAMKRSNDILGFSLRLGQNTVYCYPARTSQQLPEFTQHDGLLKFDWTISELDFAYPLEVSSTLYRVSDLLELLAQLPFSNPNTLEGWLANCKELFLAKRYLLCYPYSITFCNPVNKVQHVFANRAGEDICHSADELSELFKDGYRIAIEHYAGFIPNACHQEVKLVFKQEIFF